MGGAPRLEPRFWIAEPFQRIGCSKPRGLGAPSNCVHKDASVAAWPTSARI